MFGKKDQQADLEMFAVYDSKTDIYTEPLLAINSLDVLREFMNAFQSPEAPQKNKYFKNAEDFSLFKIGTYHRKGGIATGNTPAHIVNFHELKSQALRELARNQPGALSST